MKQETNEPKERPILFNTDMVRAILDGRKTQTRRIVKNVAEIEGSIVEGVRPMQIGDLLWVRETHLNLNDFIGFDDPDGPDYYYRASHPDLKEAFPTLPLQWRPSLFMKKEAARIWLRVTNLRAETIQKISETDAINEGIFSKYIKLFAETRWRDYTSNDQDAHGYWRCPVSSFRSLWETIHGPGSWDVNPWVWVIEFEVLSTNGKPDYWPGKQTRVDEEAERAENFGELHSPPLLDEVMERQIAADQATKTEGARL